MTAPAIPEYCASCSWIFSKMGACKPPDVSLFFSLVSFIPYLIIFAFIGLSLVARGSRQIKMAVLLISGYLVADRILKNLIGMPRPPGACKTTFGFPSSHMVALCSYVFQMFPYCNKSQKYFFLFLMISQGMARVHLKYHTWDQVFGGVAYAMIFVYAFNRLWEKVEKNQHVKRLYVLLGVQEFEARGKSGRYERKKEEVKKQ